MCSFDASIAALPGPVNKWCTISGPGCSKYPLKLCPLKLTGMGQQWCFKIPLIRLPHQHKSPCDRGLEGAIPDKELSLWWPFCKKEINLLHLFFFFAKCSWIVLNQNLNFGVHLSESFTYRFMNTQYFTVSQLICTTQVGSRVCLDFFKFSFFRFYIQIPLPVCFRAM